MIYPYYFYGSEDSTDKDVIISIPKNIMPLIHEDKKRLVHKIKQPDWNATLVVIENGVIVDTIYPKAWCDSLNNSVFNTYKFHKQDFPNPIVRDLKRNKLLAVYKTLRTCLSMLTRTEYRSILKPTTYDISKKIELCDKVKFSIITSFNQDNTKDINVWKTLAFYIGQNIALIEDDIEIYTKSDLAYNFPNLEDFIYRKDSDKSLIDLYFNYWREKVLKPFFNDYEQKEFIVKVGNEVIDVKKEISL